MALKTCPDCGNPVSTKAEACPGCGRAVTAPGRAGMRVAFLVAVIALVVVGIAAVGALARM